ncbi:MAG: DUF4886 domain-containing protein [Clostridia bacterium]|nr:DUF4886 domain-containing protein [Clostridia bacterium]
MKILSIGNSFSQDATHYLHRAARSAGVDIKTVNLYIGGCSLYTHYINMLEDKKAYAMEFNGEGTGFFVSVREALVSDCWDIVTMQQVSSESNSFETYEPYLSELSAYVRKYCPKAKQFMHQTWAYEAGSERLKEVMGYDTPELMFNDVKAAYDQAAKRIGADGIIPSGQAMLKLYEYGGGNIHRDPIHASLGLGRFALALTWFEYLTGKNCGDVVFDDFDEDIPEEKIALAMRAAHEAAEAGRC